MKHLINLVVVFLLVTSCGNKGGGSSSTGGPSGGGTTTTPQYVCQDNNASNIGSALPCQCNAGYVVNSFGTGCNIVTNPVSLAPSALFYNQNPLTLYVDQGIIVPYTPSVNNCTASAPCTYSVTTALPTGLSLNPNTGGIIGTASVPKAQQAYVIKATNMYGSTTVNLNIKVIYRPPSGLSIQNQTAVYQLNQSITQNIISYSSGIGSVETMSISPALPAGLSLQLIGNKSWAIAGTPTVNKAAQDYVITATSADGLSSTSLTINIAISSPPTALSYTGPSECVNTGGYYTCTFNFRQSFTDLIPTFNGSNVKFRIASTSSSQILPSGISLSETSGRILTTELGPFEETSYLCGGSYCTYKIEVYNELGSAFFNLKMKVNDVAPATSFAYSQPSYLFRTVTIISDLLPTVTGGVINCTGSANCFSISPALPAGLTFSSSSGRITGSPDKNSKQAPVSYTVKANDSRVPGGITSAPFTIEIKERLPVFTYTAGGTYFFNKDTDVSSVGNPRIDTSLGIETPSCGPNAIPITSFSVSPALPAGLTLSTQPFICGVIDPLPNGTNNGSGGIIYANGSGLQLSPETEYTITGCNDGGCSSAVIKIEISPYIGKIVGGEAHACALTKDLNNSEAKVMCWGDNSYMQTGATSESCTQSDTSVKDCNKKARYIKYPGSTNLTNVLSLGAGRRHSCAIKYQADFASNTNTVAYGQVICWGDNTLGQLGIGSTGNHYSSPQPVIKTDGSLLTGAVKLASGGDDTCVVAFENVSNTDALPGTTYCFGKNYGNRAVKIGGSGTPDQQFYASDVYLGSNHACAKRLTVIADEDANSGYAVDTDNTLSCWGLNNKGQLGNGSTSSVFSFTPTPVVLSNGSLLTTERAVSGGNHSCAYSNTNVLCWGDNSSGQVTGLASSGSQYIYPQSVRSMSGSGVLGSAANMGAGYNYSLAQDVNNFTLLFGAFPLSVTQYPLLSNNPTQIMINNGAAGINPLYSGGNPIIAPSAENFACNTYNRNGGIYCWGKNNLGQLGNNTNVDSELPQKIIYDFN